MKLLLLLDNQDRLAGAWMVSGWFDSMSEARNVSVTQRIVCRVAGRLLRRELLGEEPAKVRP